MSFEKAFFPLANIPSVPLPDDPLPIGAKYRRLDAQLSDECLHQIFILKNEKCQLCCDKELLIGK